MELIQNGETTVSYFQCDQIGRFFGPGQLFEAMGIINLPKSLTFLGNFCKGVKIFNFSSEIIFGQLLKTFGDFLLVTLDLTMQFNLLLIWHKQSSLIQSNRWEGLAYSDTFHMM